MCGIAGFLRAERQDYNREAGHAILEKMTQILHHRGPDGRGVWQDEYCGLAHTRLAIRDLTDSGAQPMRDQSGDLQIVYNGELYNLKALRADLKSRGVRFRGHSDTEVLIEAYKIYGQDVLQRLNGMFAFAIWDSRLKKLFLARDRVGQKPLFYGWVGDTFVFGSEIKAFMALPSMSRRISLSAIHHYLTLQYVPSPHTAYEGIYKLPPAHALDLSPGQKAEAKRYWSTHNIDTTQDISQKDMELKTEALLKDAVLSRVISDRPIGAFLSGGVDSSAITAYMAAELNDSIKTFSIGFEEDNFDERKYARQVAQHCGTEHYEAVFSVNQMADMVPKIAHHYDEPFADMSAFPTYCLSQLARQHVTVVLNGDGGDELFLGYSRYSKLQHMAWLDKIPIPLKSLLATLSHAPEYVDNFRPTRVLRRWSGYMAETVEERYAHHMAAFTHENKRDGYGDRLQSYIDDSTIDLWKPYFANKNNAASGAAYADFHTYLPDNLMTKVDMASMAHGLEARSPFLDMRLVEWAHQIPHDIKLQNGVMKGHLKLVLEPILPHECLYRPKMGFGVPLEDWLRGPLKDITFDILTSQQFRESGLFKPSYVDKLLSEHMNGIRLHHPRLWTLVMLAAWYANL